MTMDQARSTAEADDSQLDEPVPLHSDNLLEVVENRNAAVAEQIRDL